MGDSPDVAVLITAYNEARTIGPLIDDIDESYTVYVVDDGSSDGTGEIAKSMGARVIRLPVNVGQGAAAVVGYKVVVMEGHDCLVKLDGDGQHDPREIPRFVDRLAESGADMVVGSRVLGSNYRSAPLSRRVLLGPLTWILNRLTGYRVTDSMCGFRAFNGPSLARLVAVFDQIVETEYMASEMWIRFSKQGVAVAEVPISLSERKHSISHKGHALARYGLGIIRTVVRTWLSVQGGRGPNEH